MRIVLTIIFHLLSAVIWAQDRTERADYLSIQSGFNIDRYNSFGIRTFIEYQKDLKNNWQFGIAYEHSRHLGFWSSSFYDYPTNLNQLSLNGYYKLKVFKDRLFWTAGFGIGAVHIFWDEDQNKVAPTVNLSLTLNIRITSRIYIETSPLVVLLPTNRLYYSPFSLDEKYNQFFSASAFPIGIKVKL